jgi:8-oxo-dGTP pyrophosphatase MutT (NUDIX family)
MDSNLSPAISPDAASGWLAALRARASQPPATPRELLRVGAAAVGSIEPALAQLLRQSGLPVRQEGHGWVLAKPADASLARVARWLHDQGLGGRWRNELLAVVDEHGTVVAQVERAAVRVLGIATRAVHLVGATPAGAVWVQQRALDKSVDPGMLDTLAGGLAAAGESTRQTLARETWEEAGLALAALADLAPLDRLTVRRPVSDGYMVEHIEAFEAVVPDGLVPVNQDGEVMAFECMPVPGLVDALATGRFTLESALIHAAWLERRRHRP